MRPRMSFSPMPSISKDLHQYCTLRRTRAPQDEASQRRKAPSMVNLEEHSGQTEGTGIGEGAGRSPLNTEPSAWVLPTRC